MMYLTKKVDDETFGKFCQTLKTNQTHNGVLFYGGMILIRWTVMAIQYILDRPKMHRISLKLLNRLAYLTVLQIYIAF